MKTRHLLITLGAAAFAAITLNATASDTLLSPRAAGNRITHASGTASDANLVNPIGTSVSPRAAGSQIATVAGQSNEANPVAACAKNMIGGPKAVTECISHTTMPGCKPMAVASAK